MSPFVAKLNTMPLGVPAKSTFVQKFEMRPCHLSKMAQEPKRVMPSVKTSRASFKYVKNHAIQEPDGGWASRIFKICQKKLPNAHLPFIKNAKVPKKHFFFGPLWGPPHDRSKMIIF